MSKVLVDEDVGKLETFYIASRNLKGDSYFFRVAPRLVRQN